jgi:hypothetical protein
LIPALIRAVPQPIGTATLVSNLGGLQRFSTLQPQPQLIQIDGSADQVTITKIVIRQTFLAKCKKHTIS